LIDNSILAYFVCESVSVCIEEEGVMSMVVHICRLM